MIRMRRRIIVCKTVKPKAKKRGKNQIKHTDVSFHKIKHFYPFYSSFISRKYKKSAPSSTFLRPQSPTPPTSPHTMIQTCAHRTVSTHSYVYVFCGKSILINYVPSQKKTAQMSDTKTLII